MVFPLRIFPSHCSCPPRNPRTGRRMNRNWPKNMKRRSRTYRKRGKSTERSASRSVLKMVAGYAGRLGPLPVF